MSGLVDDAGPKTGPEAALERDSDTGSWSPPKRGERILACACIDGPDRLSAGDVYLWRGTYSVTRLDPPETFSAAWIALCPSCHVAYAERGSADQLVGQDFVLAQDVEVAPAQPN